MAITDNKVKNTIVINEHLTVIDDMTITNITDTDTWGDLKISWMVDGTEAKTVEESIRTVKVTDDYSQAVLGTWECLEITGGETNNDDNARLEFLANGTYNFYRLNDAGVWTLVPRERNEFFVDGILLCTPGWKRTIDKNQVGLPQCDSPIRGCRNFHIFAIQEHSKQRHSNNQTPSYNERKRIYPKT